MTHHAATLSQHASIESAARMMAERHIGAALITKSDASGSDRTAYGILTRGDVLRAHAAASATGSWQTNKARPSPQRHQN
jgi:signal-transduction protein with cAMP-binding, CBS, and nucleotidyltransferase domain